MPQRTTQHQGGGKSRTESKKEGEKREGKSGDTGRQRSRMASEQPSYEALNEDRSGGSAGRAEAREHRADTSRMGKKGRGGSSGAADRSPDIDEGPARGESRGFSEDSGGALSDDTDVSGRSQRGATRGRAQDPDEVNQAGFSKPSSERSDEDVGRGTSPRGASSPRGPSGGRAQEPTARGGFIEPDERTSGSSRRR